MPELFAEISIADMPEVLELVRSFRLALAETLEFRCHEVCGREHDDQCQQYRRLVEGE